MQIQTEPLRHLHQLRQHQRAHAHAYDVLQWRAHHADKSPFPTFSSTINVNGQAVPYTMVGFPPASGKTARIKTVLVPLRVVFTGFEQAHTFDPAPAVANIINSPLYQDAQFPNGTGQFGDQLQRATFWNVMDADKNWHVRLAPPRVAQTIDIRVEPDVGELSAIGSGPDDLIGNVRFGLMDSTIHTSLQLLNLERDEVPIFVTYNVTADALGFHDAFPAVHQGADTLDTVIYASWLEQSLVGDLLDGVSTLAGQVGNWLNDPYVTNVVGPWLYPPPSNGVCSNNPFVEVADPLGDSPNFFAFPNVPIRVGSTSYPIPDVVMLPWFAGEQPSSAQNGWYDFPDTTKVVAPATFCP